MKAQYHKGHPAADYRGAHVITPEGRLGEVVAVGYEEGSPSVWRARLRHFNGDPFPSKGYLLSQLDILTREET